MAICLLPMAQGCASELSRREFLSSDGVKLSFLEAGREHCGGDRLSIAMITGWAMPAAIWRNQLQTFGRRFYALALDPRGQGESELPAGGFNPERRATDIKEFLDPLSKVLLIGWSLGAIESLQYIHMFGAERLAGMVLVDSSIGEEPAPPSSGAFLQALRDARDKTIAGFVRSIFTDAAHGIEIEALIAGAKRLPLENSVALLSYPLPRTHWKEIAHRFKKPLLYVVTPQFEEQAKNLQNNRPGTAVEIFSAAGHALFVDEADRFNAIVLQFAESLPDR